MKVPLWIWDHRLDRYVNVPPGALKVYPDGMIGIDAGQPTPPEIGEFLTKYQHLFKSDHKWPKEHKGLLALIPGRYVLRQSKRPKKQPWYAKQHIRGYQSE